MKEPLKDIVLTIYDTVASPSRWPDVLDRLTDDLDAHGCIIFEWDGTGPDRKLKAPHFSGRFVAQEVLTYLDRCFEDEARDQDIFEAHSLRSDAIDLLDDTILAPDLSSLKQRRNVQILQKFGILHRAAGLLDKDNTAHARFSVQLGADRGQLTPQERAYLQMVLPHLAKALDLCRPAQQLAQEHQSMMAAMDRLTIGICILDGQGRVVVFNEEFRRQRDSVHVFLVTSDGRLRLTRSDDQHRFEKLKSDALHHGQYGARPRKEAVSSGPDTFLCIEVAPLNRSDEIGSGTFGGSIVYSMDTALPQHCDTRPIQHAYGLSDTELELMDGIAKGLTNVEIAERRSRAVATVNNQVKSILSKTQCATRTQFVRLMTRFGSSFLADDR